MDRLMGGLMDVWTDITDITTVKRIVRVIGSNTKCIYTNGY